MANSAPAQYGQGTAVSLQDDAEIWAGLKDAIASSSGFQRWKLERDFQKDKSEEMSLDFYVRRYLRETLETLAY